MLARRATVALWVLAGASIAMSPSLVRAQETVLVSVDDGAPRARQRRWERRLAELIDRPADWDEWSARAEPVGTIEPEALEVIDAIEQHLRSAREAATRLEERAALAELARAEALALDHLAIPGITAWYAEVELAIAITAAQAQIEPLAEAAMRRAASVDPLRSIRAAEAAPPIVEANRRALLAASTAPRGRFEVRTDAVGARAFLDERPLGVLPRRLDAAIGPHVLRIEAPGRVTWARRIDVLEGERPPLVIALAPSARAIARARARDAAERGDLPAFEALREHAPPSVWILRVGAGPLDRALLDRCAPSCVGPIALRADPDAPALRVQLAEATPIPVARADRFLAESARRAPIGAEPPFFERWYVWTAAGVVIASAIAAIVIAAQPQGPGPLIVDVDPAELP